jgi:tetratricopeptide (TPR) repeat protein
MKITLVMVLKNEGRTVRKAIESVLSIVDEAVIAIDDKTKDNTREEVHKALGNKYTQFYDFTFKDDFASLRNEFTAKANHEWVFILDGHEYLDQSCLPLLKELKNAPPQDIQIFDFNIYDPQNGQYFQQPRLFRKGIQYELPIHNVISQREKRISMPQIVIYHDQPEGRYQERREQRRKMNIKGLKEKANKGDVRSMYYLADAFRELGDLKNAEHWFKKYIPKSNFPHERYAARICMALIRMKEEKLDEAESYLVDCFGDDVNLNEHLFLMGDIKYKQKNYYRAVYYYRLATTIKIPEIFLIINKDCYTWFPWYKLALAYIMMNDLDGIRECINKGKQLAPERDEFFEIEAKIQERIKVHDLKKKGKLYIVASIPQFIEPYIKAFVDSGDYYIRFEQKFDPQNADNADVIFCEWADHNAIAVSNFNTKAKKIIRIHAYEVFSDLIDKINFYNVDQLIFVANHIKDYFIKRIEGWEVDLKTTVISNGIDLDRFQIAPNKKANNKIAWAGFISNKKGAVLLLHTAQNLPDYEFHVCGTFQERDVQYLFENHSPKNLILYPWQEDLNRFFVDKTYILNTSPREGCPVSVLEGMACGLRPLVYDWIGAKNFFNATWSDLDVLKRILLDQTVNFKYYRKFIESNFDFKEKKQAIKNIIDYYMPIIEEKDHARKNNKVAVQAV